MNVPTITMPVDQAKEKLKAYRSNIHRDAEQIYSEVANGYKALAAGTPLIQLSVAVQSGGFDEKMRPRIAIHRADQREVKLRWSGNETTARFGTTTWGGSSERSRTLNTIVNMGRSHGRTNGNGYHVTIEAFALVPADVRPKHGQLKDWFVLWEVDHWYDRSQTARASRDPMLLKHIGGDLYAVLAQWDLTPLEIAILEARQVR